jgi:hypothetical protein
VCSGLDVAAYWAALAQRGVDAARLASYDRPITHAPSFSPQHAATLRPDLAAYLTTLRAVHGGHDLHAAALGVLGYTQARAVTAWRAATCPCLAPPCL